MGARLLLQKDMLWSSRLPFLVTRIPFQGELHLLPPASHVIQHVSPPILLGF